jgi:hypothetical protein
MEANLPDRERGLRLDPFLICLVKEKKIAYLYVVSIILFFPPF